MIKAWTFGHANESLKYWHTQYDGPLVLIEGVDLPLQFRKVKDGTLSTCEASAMHRGKPLPIEHWPQWLHHLHTDYSMDEGL